MCIRDRQYTKAINDKSSAFIRTETKFIGNTYFNSDNSIHQSPYSVQNCSIGLQLKKASIVAWSKNVLNQKYISYAYDFGAVHLGDPATFGISFSHKF